MYNQHKLTPDEITRFISLSNRFELGTLISQSGVTYYSVRIDLGPWLTYETEVGRAKRILAELSDLDVHGLSCFLKCKIILVEVITPHEDQFEVRCRRNQKGSTAYYGLGATIGAAIVRATLVLLDAEG